MSAKASDSREREEAADLAAGFGRLAAEMLENARAFPVHPLMVHPAAAFAAATAIGFGLSTQMASAFFGALQGAMKTTNELAAAFDDTPPEEPKPEVDIRPEHIRQAAGTAESRPGEGKAAKPKLTVVSRVDNPVLEAKPAARAKPARARKADDLKLIAGIGPKLEQVLNARGVRSFAEIAAWTDEEVARLDAELGVNGRIVRDDWVGQAKVLSARGRRRK
ncbi:5' DNA nuclease [Rhizobium binxianense]